MKPATLSGPGIRCMVSESTGVKIPTIAARGLVFTAWQPSPEEVEGFKKGAMLWLVQRGTYIPEMSMIVGQQEDVVPRDIQLEALEDVSPDRQRMMEELLDRKEQAQRKATFRSIVVFVLISAVIGVIVGSILRRILGL